MKQLPDLKQDYPWIKDVPSQSLQAVIERLDKSYQQIFKGGGFPRWARKKTYKSIHLKSISVVEHTVILPKMGAVRMGKDAPIQGIPKTAQIVLEPTGIFICMGCEVPDQKPSSESQAMGIDMGISHFCILSDGTLAENPRHFKKHERKLRRGNRSLSRKKKGSNRWKKQVKRLAKLHHTIRNVRRDFLHKTSTQIARKYATVYVEDLNIKGMVKHPRRSKHILDSGWGLFRSMLEYKTKVVKVNPQYTSQTCNVCGVKDARSRFCKVSLFVPTAVTSAMPMSRLQKIL
jgi:putative transposase